MKDNKFYVTKDEFVYNTFDELDKKAAERFKEGRDFSKALEEQEKNVY